MVSLNLLLRIAKDANILPQSYYVSSPTPFDPQTRQPPGYYSAVSKATWEGRSVAVKAVLTDRFSATYINVLRQIINWRQLSHPNLAQFFGINNDVFGPRTLAVISKWEENGSVNNAIQNLPLEELETLRPRWVSLGL